jgi:hypothetical protein
MAMLEACEPGQLKKAFFVKKTGIFIQIISALWIISIASLFFVSISDGKISWRASHIYYIDIFHSILTRKIEIFPLLSLVIIISVEYIFLCLWKRFHSKQKSLDIHLSPFGLLIIFSFIFFIIAFIWFMYHHIARDAFIAPYPGIFFHYGSVAAVFSFVLLLCASIGKYAFNCLKREGSYDLKEFLFSFGLGVMLIVLLLFILGCFRWLQSAPLWIILGVLLSLAHKELWQWLKIFFRPQIHFQGAYADVRIILFLLFSIVLGHNILELIRPIPIGFDDTSIYINLPHLIAQKGGLLSGYDAYSWELFVSLGYVLFHSTTITLFLSCLGGILAFLGIYVSVKSYCEQRSIHKSQGNGYALFAATLFYSLPAVVFQSTKDMKVDLGVQFFMILAFISILSWRNEGQHNFGSLWLTGLFMGFSFTIKYTALFFIIAMSLAILMLMAKRKEKRSCIAFLIYIVCIGTPFLPYGIKNIAETKQLSVQSLRSGKSSAPVIAANPPMTSVREQLPDISKGVQEEQGRYLGYDHGIRKYLLLPFTVTFNPLVSGAYVDIGYVFLAVIPLIIIMHARSHKKSETNSSPLLLQTICFGSLYWLLWALFAKGVIWYGYGGFIFLLILIIEVLYQLKDLNWTFLRYITNSAIVFWLVCAICLRTVSSSALSIDPVGLAYAAGTIDENEYIKQNVPAYLNISRLINDDIDKNKENPPKTYRVGTYIKYFIHQNNILVLDDNQLDIFMFLTQDHDDQKTIARFKNAGIKYLIIDTNTPDLDRTPGKTLRTKYQALIRFIKQNRSNFDIIYDEPLGNIQFIEIRQI